jgi:hypothetical protein
VALKMAREPAARTPPVKDTVSFADQNMVLGLASIMPAKSPEMLPRDFLIMLLHVAAELEHALMVQYLYAAYSLGGPATGEHAGLVRTWRDELLTIAREEMGHLISVQNLLLLVGGPVCFARRHYPWSSPYYPAPFNLERLSLDSLARYVYAEMPLGIRDDRHKVVRERVLDLLGFGPGHPHVGELYMQIIHWLGDRQAIPDSIFDAESRRYQVSWDEFGRGYRPDNQAPNAKASAPTPQQAARARVIVAQMSTRTEALAALRDLAGQGEAENAKLHDGSELSHFDRFSKVFLEFDGILSKNPGWSPSRPVPKNPFAGTTKDQPAHTTLIASEGSRVWANLFNIRYRMLLSLLTFIYRIPRDENHTRRAQILARIFGEMYHMKTVAGILVRLPFGDPGDEARAAPPFELPYTFALPSSEEDFWRTQLDLIDAADQLVKRLRGKFLPGLPADGERYLQALAETDKDARAWIVRILAGNAVGTRSGR